PASAAGLFDRSRQDRAVLHASAQEDPVSGAPARDDAAARDVEEPPRPEVERAPAGRDDVAVLAQKRELASDGHPQRDSPAPEDEPRLGARREEQRRIPGEREAALGGDQTVPADVERPQPPMPVADARNARAQGLCR